ncbi:MAG: phage virion morphogenesis protein [Hoeflea sp.]|uniref:phage virion morphogenesis protein n=1 Tax=Hoeflea sp. TaxID=1940281 RepID=UPI000C0CA241|nr:phage virion morphogenesis protein [Hoeflea sp.]PHR19285.1 MAG: phage virion morphogenesis protein [Hoeflea sp.]
MTGISYEIEIDNVDIEAELRRRLAQMEDLTPFHTIVGEHLLVSLDERFESETSPDGSPWQRHAPATTTHRLKKHGNAPLTILRLRGRLAGSFSYQANSDHARVGTPVVYAAIHHFGGKAGRNRKVTIPARPYLGLSAVDQSAMIEIAEEWLGQ